MTFICAVICNKSYRFRKWLNYRLIFTIRKVFFSHKLFIFNIFSYSFSFFIFIKFYIMYFNYVSNLNSF